MLHSRRFSRFDSHAAWVMLYRCLRLRPDVTASLLAILRLGEVHIYLGLGDSHTQPRLQLTPRVMDVNAAVESSQPWFPIHDETCHLSIAEECSDEPVHYLVLRHDGVQMGSCGCPSWGLGRSKMYTRLHQLSPGSALLPQVVARNGVRDLNKPQPCFWFLCRQRRAPRLGMLGTS